MILQASNENLIARIFAINDEVISKITSANTMGNVIDAIETPFYLLVTLGIIAIGANMLMQWKEMDHVQFVRYLIVVSFVGSFGLIYGNLYSIYEMLLAVPNELGTTLINSTSNENFNSLPEVYDSMLADSNVVLQAINDNAGMFSGAIAAIFYAMFSLFYIAICVVSMLAYQILMAIILLLSPIFIALYILPATKRYTDGFISLTVSVSIFPIFMAGVTAVILGLEDLFEVRTDFKFSYLFDLIFIYIIGMILIFISGQVVQSIASTSVDIAGAGRQGLMTALGIGAGSAYIAGKAGDAGVSAGRSGINTAKSLADRYSQNK